MAEKSLDKFIKLMMLTTSSNDAEALSALRKAQMMLATSNQSWEQFIRKQGLKLNPDQERNERVRTSESGRSDKEIEDRFNILYDKISPDASIMEFIESVYQWWRSKGYLTVKQEEALFRIYF